jgi:hypothetical protein
MVINWCWSGISGFKTTVMQGGQVKNTLAELIGFFGGDPIEAVAKNDQSAARAFDTHNRAESGRAGGAKFGESTHLVVSTEALEALLGNREEGDTFDWHFCSLRLGIGYR